LPGWSQELLCTLRLVAGDERVIQYLREARADELALARTLRTHIAAAPRGDYRDGLQGYLVETRTHARRVQGRLGDLGAAESPLRSGARFLLEASGGMLALGRVPLKGVAREKRRLRGAQFGCATQGFVIATYTALELVAQRAGDPDTARLAAEIRAEEQRMLEWLRHEILKLTDPFIREELDEHDGWAEHGEVSEEDVQRALHRAEGASGDRL
jgi:ferritin-like metal-binding protein YciE